MTVRIRALAAGSVLAFLGLLVCSVGASATTVNGGSSTSYNGHWSMDVSCTTGSCSGQTTTESFDLIQTGNTISGTMTDPGGKVSPVSGTAAAGSSAGLAATVNVGGNAVGSLDLLLSPDGSTVTGSWDKSESGIAGTLGGNRGGWSGHWSVVITCGATGCAQGPSALFLDFVQNGSSISGKATFAADKSVVVPVTGTATELSATIKGLTPSSTILITISQDGVTFAGTVTITDPTSGVTSTFGTVAGTRSEGAALAVGVSANVPQVGLGLRRSADVTVIVTALNGAVNGISFGDIGLLGVSPELEVTSTPSDMNGFSLADGKSKSFVFRVKAVEAGDATVGVVLDGTDGAGDDVNGSGWTTVKVGGAQLQVTVTGTPSSLLIRNTDQSGQARFVTADVTFTNKGKKPVDGVQLLSLVVVPVDHSQALQKLSFPAADFPRHIGTIAPGDSTVETFKVNATGGFGTYEVEALALFDDPSAAGGNGRVFATGAKFDVVTTTPKKIVEFNSKGQRKELYLDPTTGAILGRLNVVDPRTHANDVFFYNVVTGEVDLRDPQSGAKAGASYDPATSKVTVTDPNTGNTDVLHYDASGHKLFFVDSGTGKTYPVFYSQVTGDFVPVSR